jgi:hypothetical protein
MSRAEHEQLPPSREKPREETIDRFLDLLTTFTERTFSKRFERDFDRDEDGFDKITVVINDPHKRYRRRKLIGKITFTTSNGSSEVSTSYQVMQGKNGREVKYVEDSTLVSRSKTPPQESVTNSDRKSFENVMDINLKDEMKLFGEDLGTVTEADFKSTTDDLEVLMLKYNIY